MDPRSDNLQLEAPGRPSARSTRMGLDDRLVVPELRREEMLDGQRLRAAPAEYQHADPHCRLDALVTAHAKPDYIGSTDLLTRVGEASDFASDTCIRRSGFDPATGERHLEELAFEVIHRRGRKENDRRAASMIERGVRRIIGIFVLRETVAEFEPKAGRWRTLDPDDVIDDPCLVRPLPVRALLDSALAEAAVVEALETRGSPAIETLKQQSAADGRREGAAAMLSRLLTSRFGRLPPNVEQRLAAADDAELARIGERLLTAVGLEQIFGG